MDVESPAEGTAVCVADTLTNSRNMHEAEPVANIANVEESLEDILQAAQATDLNVAPIVDMQQILGDQQMDEVSKGEHVKIPKEPETFSLGVPGLEFSMNNVKTAEDGTKMVQIHQSQLTPDQLQALQNNPNVKVVFRHIPSGKSYAKPPKNLLPPGYSSPIKKRKAHFTEEDLEAPDIYSFNEGVDLEGPTKRTKLTDSRVRYSYGDRKRGRPRKIPDSTSFTSMFDTSRQSGLPAKVILTDLLARVNNTNAKNDIKLHTSQINAEVLANMELHPAYRIVLTVKHELPPLVIENIDAVEQEKLKQDRVEEEKKMEKEEKEKVQQEVEKMEEDVQKEEEDVQEDNEEEDKSVEEQEETEPQKEGATGKKVGRKVEQEAKDSPAHPQKSRSGRVRKPSRYSLDIALLTKRKSMIGGGHSSTDESENETNAAVKANQPVVALTPLEETGRLKKITSPPAATEKSDEEAEEEKLSPEETPGKTETDSEKKKEPTESEKSADTSGQDNKVAEEVVDGQEEQIDVANKKDEVTPMEQDTSMEEEKAATEKYKSKPTESTASDEAPGSKPSDEAGEEPEVIDNKYRLRKLLEQCSTEEIRSVLLPEAFDSINIGDFLLFKAGQMSNSSGKVSFPRLYKEFENLHKDATKEATRYNTLVRRASKVGGDKRMEKIVLMPVYNIDAANSLAISNTSIDAHICGIQRTITTEMIAANSFFIKSKMDPPLVRLKLPEATARKQPKPKERKPLFSNQYQQQFVSQQQQAPDSTTPDKPKPQKRQTYGQKISAMRFTTYQGKIHNSENGTQAGRQTYAGQIKTASQITLRGQNHLGAKTQEMTLQTTMDTSSLKADVQSSQMVASATSALAQLQATVDQQAAASTPDAPSAVATADTKLVTSDGAGQVEQLLEAERGVQVTTASDGEGGEVQKHLVPIGDGQYVELPEGYSLIQTDDGYIIGQPGSTFSQGEDGNVYITNSDGTTTEITQKDISGAGEAIAVTQATDG